MKLCFFTPNTKEYIIRRDLTSLGLFISSDHRGIYLDINILILLKTIFINRSSQESRLLTSTNPHIVIKYINEIMKYSSKYNIITQVSTIQTQIDDNTISTLDMN